MNEQAIHILLVEDNPGDAFLISRTLKQNPNTVLHQVTNGREALSFLHEKSPTHRQPDLMLLDLNLPQVNGYQVLEQVKTNPDLLHIPIIVLSSSSATEDILRSYRLHANCYLTKPLTLQDSTVVMQTVEQFWLTWACLPKAPVAASI